MATPILMTSEVVYVPAMGERLMIATRHPYDGYLVEVTGVVTWLAKERDAIELTDDYGKHHWFHLSIPARWWRTITPLG